MSNVQPDGYLALPTTDNGRAVLVLHAWWGLNDTIRSVCDRLAEAGFVAFALDLYHGQVADTIADAERLGGEVDANFVQTKAEVVAAAQYLSEYAAERGAERGGERGLAVVAFSLGAFYALSLAATAPDLVHSVVVFYGTDGTMGSDFSNSRAAYLGHFAENDVYETQSNVDILEAALRKAGRPLIFYIYPDTGHWFFEPDRPDAYNSEAASLAWDRTLAFLKRPSTS